MNTKTFIKLAFVCLLACSCKKELEPQDSDGVMTAPVAENTAAATPNAQPAVQNAPAPQPTQIAAGMNPPHGQPNHRCDIAVGAPLNSPPGKPAAAAPVAPQPAMTINPAQAATKPAVAVKTAAGMNPPHGQPNHRCDIAVGAPLNSPPGKPAATPSLVDPTLVKSARATTEQAPAILNSTPAAVTATAPGMNPPHGQDGHRCDVAVGAPLPKS